MHWCTCVRVVYLFVHPSLLLVEFISDEEEITLAQRVFCFGLVFALLLYHE